MSDIGRPSPSPEPQSGNPKENPGALGENNQRLAAADNQGTVGEALALLQQPGGKMRVAVSPLDYEEADAGTQPGPKPDPEKSRFDLPYNKEKAEKLIGQLGSADTKEQKAAADQLQRMGPQVIPQLEQAKLGNPEAAQLRAGAIEFIKTESGKEQYRNATNALNQSMPGWDDLLYRSGAQMTGNNDILQLTDEPGMPAFADAEGRIHEMGPMLLTGGRKSAPSKEEQQKIDALLQKLDGIDTKSPDFQKKLEDARKLAKAPGATLEQKLDYLKLHWLQYAKSSARDLYVDSLALSKDPSSLDKGRKMFMDDMKKQKGELNEWDAENIAMNAVRYGVEKRAEFLDAFRARGGSLDQINEARERLNPPPKIERPPSPW